MKPALLPQLFLAGVICFFIGTVISIHQTIKPPANVNCGADRP